MIPYLGPHTFPFAQARYEPEASESQAPVHPETKIRKPVSPPRESHVSGSLAATLELLILRIMWFV